MSSRPPRLSVLAVAVRAGRTGTALVIDGRLATADLIRYPDRTAGPDTVRRYAYRDAVRWACTIGRDLAEARGRPLDVLAVGEPGPPGHHRVAAFADLEAARLVGYLEGLDPDPARLVVIAYTPADGAGDLAGYPAAMPEVCRVAYDVAGAAVLDSRLRDLFG